MTNDYYYDTNFQHPTKYDKFATFRLTQINHENKYDRVNCYELLEYDGLIHSCAVSIKSKNKKQKNDIDASKRNEQ